MPARELSDPGAWRAARGIAGGQGRAAGGRRRREVYTIAAAGTAAALPDPEPAIPRRHLDPIPSRRLVAGPSGDRVPADQLLGPSHPGSLLPRLAGPGTVVRRRRPFRHHARRRGLL